MPAMLFTSLASDILNSLKYYLSVHLSLDKPRLMSAIVSKQVIYSDKFTPKLSPFCGKSVH